MAGEGSLRDSGRILTCALGRTVVGRNRDFAWDQNPHECMTTIAAQAHFPPSPVAVER